MKALAATQTASSPSSTTGWNFLLQRKCACGGAAGVRGTCEECADKQLLKQPLQAKLMVGSADDPLEREADRVAEQVMSGVPPRPSTSPDGAAPKLRRLPTATPNLKHAPDGVQQVLGSPGRPLDACTRAFFEPRFERDFSSVRVHADDTADRSARALDARAYTVGNHLVFSRGSYSPSAEGGRRLLAHELAHVVQQSHTPDNAPAVQRKSGGRGPGRCGLLSAATATLLGGAAHVQIQNRLAGRGLAKELPIPRATKTSGVGSRKCEPLGTSWGYADVARINKPGAGLSEIKPFWIAGTVGLLEARHYRLRAEQSKQRLTGTGSCGKRGADADDQAFNALVGPLMASSTFDLLKGAISGTEDFGPFSMDKHRNLLAKEVGTGAIGYWCKLNDEGKKKKKEKEEKRKRKEAERKKKADEKKKPTEKPKDKPKEKPKDKPKEKPKKSKPKTSASAGAGNVGFGISIFSTSVGGANAGVGISVGSNSARVGTAGAGISWFSDSAAAGAAGAGVAKDSSSAAAGAVGAGVAEDSDSVAAGAAGAGTTKGTMYAGAGVAGTGKAENSQSAAAGAAGKGEVKDSTVAGAGATGSGKVEGVTGAGTGSPKKPADPKDLTGPNADKVPPGESDEEVAPEGGKPGQQQGEGRGGNEGDAGGVGEKGENGQPGGQPGGQGGQTPPPGATGQQGQKGQQLGGGTTPGLGTGAGTSSVNLGVMPVFPFDANEADREKAGAEAAKVALLLKDVQQAQKLLLEYLANKESNGQYVVPTSQWVHKLLNATKGLKPEDLEYLIQLDWKPGSISEEELRKRVLKALENRDKRKPAESGDAGKPAKEPDEGTGGGKGGGEGAGEGADKADNGAKGDAGSGTAGGGKGPSKSGSSRVTDPPEGLNREEAGKFKFKILEGITAANHPAPEESVECKIAVEDEGRKFELYGVSITFVGKETDREIMEEGVTYISTVFKLRFTKDFWSDEYRLHGLGGPDSLTDYEFRRKKGK